MKISSMFLAALVLAGCSSSKGGTGGSASTACVPGAQVSCACPEGESPGIQVCKPDGSGFGSCACLALGSSSSSSSSSSGSSSSSSSSSSGGLAGPALDPDIVAMISQVSSTNLLNSVTTLSNFTTRNLCSDDSVGMGANTIGDARNWIMTQFQAIPGLTKVTLDPFTYAGCDVDAAAITRESVVAWKIGAGHPDRIIVVGGHYDSRTINVFDGVNVSPGANDSGSQTSLVLEAARVMAPYTYDATVVFVAFAGEEQGLLGSANLAQGYKQYFTPTAQVEAMFNCDIVGGDNTENDSTTLQQFRLFSPGTPREINSENGSTDDTSPSRVLMHEVAYWGGAYVPTMQIIPELREDRPGRGGDHESFIAAGYPAVRFIETVESPNAGTNASHEHSPNDMLMYVTPTYTQRVAQVVISSMASLARAPSPPSPAILSSTAAGIMVAPQITATGTSAGPVSLTWMASSAGAAVDHYVVAARAATSNYYSTRISVPPTTLTKSVTPADLGLTGTPAFFISVAAVDATGHESLFAFPEYRCDATSCIVPPQSVNITLEE